jgi:hypothetical protein
MEGISKKGIDNTQRAAGRQKKLKLGDRWKDIERKKPRNFHIELTIELRWLGGWLR